jgi:hypothetical protein
MLSYFVHFVISNLIAYVSFSIYMATGDALSFFPSLLSKMQITSTGDGLTFENDRNVVHLSISVTYMTIQSSFSTIFPIMINHVI